MKQIKHLVIFALFCLAATQTFAQPAVGEWTDYQSYAQASCVVDAGDKIYCVTNGGLFSYSKTDNSVQKITGISGLSDAGIQTVAYSAENDLLLIAYQNANIDLLTGNKIYNLSDIKRKQISADKTINNIMFSGNLAYLSCGFGIVVINLERKEIKDTYIIGADGDYLNVQDMATDGNYFYAATVNGIYRADVSNPNLQNYNNWRQQTSVPHADEKFNHIEYFKGKLIANYTPDKYSEDEMYVLSDGYWQPFLTNIHYVSDITQNSNYIVFSGREEVFVYDQNFTLLSYVNKYTISGAEVKPVQTSCAVLDADNVLWVADQTYGLVKVETDDERIIPDGPADNRVFSLSMNGEDLWIADGGRDLSWNNLFFQPVFQLNRSGKWSVFDKNIFPEGNDFRDIVCVTADPNDPDHFFAGSWGGGVLEFKNGSFYKRYDNFNSTLQTQLPDSPSAPYVRIGGMAYDSKGNLWVTNTGVAKVLSSLGSDGTWTAYSLSGAVNKFIGNVVVTKDDDKWIVLPRGNGLYVLNSTNDLSKEQKVIAYFTNGKVETYTEMNDVYSMTKDLNGEIWVGTSAGVAVFRSPENIWSGTMYASRPGLNQHDGLFHPLLEKETVTAIAVDGANRKWIGTKSSGIFLVSEDGETELEHFTTDNSPLTNDEITSIAINQKTGEVFIGTASGLISYMGEAVEANDEFADVYVYPNPVRETYSGTIVVSGLIEKTDVKITDITGNLVYKTTSLGGQATWDGKNLNGNRCKTGVYLVFMTGPNGEKTKMTKLLFIH